MPNTDRNPIAKASLIMFYLIGDWVKNLTGVVGYRVKQSDWRVSLIYFHDRLFHRI
jgi:hypothetical protein